MKATERAAIDAAEQKAKKYSAKRTFERNNEIRAIAGKVHKLSFNYHLTHAVFGSEEVLMECIRESYEDEYAKANEALVEAARQKNKEQVKEFERRIKKLNQEVESKRRHILIRYIKMDDDDGGRVINNDKSNNDKRFFILLPKKLKEGILNKKDEFNVDVVENLRKKMAHELGHIVLHYDIIPKDDQSGTKCLDNTLMDKEAKVFEEKLIYLYCKKNHHINYEAQDRNRNLPAPKQIKTNKKRAV